MSNKEADKLLHYVNIFICSLNPYTDTSHLNYRLLHFDNTEKKWSASCPYVLWNIDIWQTHLHSIFLASFIIHICAHMSKGTLTKTFTCFCIEF
jgi:hypothetical protein